MTATSRRWRTNLRRRSGTVSRTRFAVAYEKRQTAEDTVEQGRAYVDAYVQFTHFANETDHLAEAGAAH
jgi:hypothetical protein